MSKLKSEIEQYLLENDFSLVENTGYSDTVFTYEYAPYNIYRFILSFEPEDDFGVVDLESRENGKLNGTFIERFVIKSLGSFKFISTHCSRSPLFDDRLITSQVH